MNIRWNITRTIAAMTAAAIAMSCGGPNYFTPMSVKTSDEAIFEDAKKLVDQQDWDGALAKISGLSASFRSTPEVVKYESSAHAGKCGLNLLQFMQDIGGAGSLFQKFMGAFTTTPVDVSECQEAQSVIEGTLGTTAAMRLATAGSYGTDINTFMAILGMAKIGTQLRDAADPNMDGDYTGFNACMAGEISDAEVAQVGTGFALLIDNFTTIAADLGSSADAITDIQDDCALIVPNPCTTTDPEHATWSDPIALTAFRALIKSDDMGLGVCNNANPFTCCP